MLGKAEAFHLDPGLWVIMRALMDAPGSPSELAARTGFPLARVVRDLDRLRRHGLLEERGFKWVAGPFQERVYALKDVPVEIPLSGLKALLQEVERGALAVARGQAKGFVSLVSKRVPAERARELLAEVARFRARLEGEPEGESGVLLSVALAPWVEGEVD